MGIFDKVCSAEMMLQYPKLYSPSQNGEHLNVKVFWGWIIVAIIHSVILYWLPMLMCQHDTLWGSGLDQSYLVLGNFVYTVSIFLFSNHLRQKMFLNTNLICFACFPSTLW